MLRVTVELVPWGDETRRKTLGTMLIVNDGTAHGARGNYDVQTFRPGRPVTGLDYFQTRSDARRAARVGRVEDWPRKSRPVWELLLRALREVGYKDAVS